MLRKRPVIQTLQAPVDVSAATRERVERIVTAARQEIELANHDGAFRSLVRARDDAEHRGAARESIALSIAFAHLLLEESELDAARIEALSAALLARRVRAFGLEAQARVALGAAHFANHDPEAAIASLVAAGEIALRSEMSSCAIDAFRCAAQVLAWLGRDEDALDALLSALALADHTLPDGGKPDLSAAVEATVALCLLHGLEAQAESLVSLLVELQQGAASRVPQSGVFEAGARPTPSPWSPTPWPTQL